MNETARTATPDSSQPERDLLARFILIRMLPGKTPPTRSKLLGDLKPYFAVPRGLSDAAWGELLDGHLDALVEAGRLSRRPYALTKSGRRRALELLGLEALPANCRWSTLKSRYLMAQALGVEPRVPADWARIADGQEGFKAALLARLFDLPVGRLPTLNQVIAALAAARGLRPARNDVNSLREAALRHWVQGGGQPLSGAGTLDESSSPKPTPTPPPGSQESAAAPTQHPTQRSEPRAEGLEAFAKRVLHVARASPRAKGGEKVFLRHVWGGLQREPGGAGLTRAQFDERLVEANRRGLLTLSRADMVGPLDAEDVRGSEIRLPHGGVVHFVRIDRERS